MYLLDTSAYFSLKHECDFIVRNKGKRTICRGNLKTGEEIFPLSEERASELVVCQPKNVRWRQALEQGCRGAEESSMCLVLSPLPLCSSAPLPLELTTMQSFLGVLLEVMILERERLLHRKHEPSHNGHHISSHNIELN